MVGWRVALEVLLLAVLLLCSLAHSSESLNTKMSTSQVLSGGSSGVSSLGIGVTIGVAGTIPVAVIVCCICYACHRRRIQLAHRSVPEQPAISMTENVGYHSSTAAVSVMPTLNPAYSISSKPVPEQPAISMTENVGYHSSTAAVSVVPTLNPAYSISSKPDHLYEKFPEDEKETSTTRGRADKGDDYYYISNEAHPEGHTNDPGRKGNNNEKNDVNISSFPEGARPAQTSGKTGNKKIRDKDYYANDDLFPEETQATAQRKEDSRGSIGQNKNDQSVDMAEEKRKRSHGEETDSILDEEGYLKMER